MRSAHDAPTVVLAHGAGAAMDSSWMNDFCARLAVRGIRTARFEFGYMAARRDGVRRPAPRAETVVGEYRDVVAAVVDAVGPVVVGGKSFGGRVASLVADELHANGSVAGLVCLGYPFHPPQKPGQLRTAQLADLRTPTLMCQGTRDPLGTREEVAGYVLSDAIEMRWLEDGDHDFRPRVKVSGYRIADHLDAAAGAVAAHATDWIAKAQNN
jgi:predicted alpha/beta-hydrolase family hydrolase